MFGYSLVPTDYLAALRASAVTNSGLIQQAKADLATVKAQSAAKDDAIKAQAATIADLQSHALTAQDEADLQSLADDLHAQANPPADPGPVS